MNDRERLNEQAARPDARNASPQGYYFPPASYPEPGRRAAQMPDVSSDIEAAVAQFTARRHALDGDPAPAASPALPPMNYAAAPDLSGLERQLRTITAQIETLRQPADLSGILADLRRELADIGRSLTEAMPKRAIEALENEVRGLGQRIDVSRQAGGDPQAIAGMERSLNEVRETLFSLKPAESLAGFDQAIRNLSDRLDHVGAAYQDPASLQQLEGAITALRGIVAHVASNDALAALAAEVRGLAAKVDRVALPSNANDPASLLALEQHLASLPILGVIERGFSDLKGRLDALLNSPPSIDPVPAVDYLKRDLVRTQDSLEAVHSTLGHVVDRLAMIEGGIRDANLAPEPPPPPGHRAPKPFATSQNDQPAQPYPTFDELEPKPMPDAPPRAALTPAPQTTRSRPVPPQHERQPIDSNLPADFPLEPGSGVPRARPLNSAADRIAASEAALGAAKPSSANHPGQTNFIAAARRAAQTAAASAPPESAAQPGDDAESPSRSIGQKMRSLFVGAGVILIVVASARVAIELLDTGHLSIAEVTMPAEAEIAEIPDQAPKAPQTAQVPAFVMPKPADSFAAAPSGILVPERPKVSATRTTPQSDPDVTGSIAKRSAPSPEPEASRDPMPSLPEKLPATLRNAAAKGNAAAEYEIGIRYLEGRTVPQNTEEALRWLERAAQSGITLAHFRIGGLYEKGLGVKKDLIVARRHYIAAADKGNAKAMHNLAVIYAEGIDGKPDYKTAGQWFRRAAEHGVADSQYNLGILFARGIGVDQNLAESYKWFSLAAIQGDRDAAKKRDDVGSRIDAASLAAAKSATQTFSPQPQPDEAITVSAPPGGWDRPTADTAPVKKPRAGAARVTAS